MNKSLLCVCGVAGLGLTMADTAQAIIIDDFDTGPGVVQTFDPGTGTGDPGPTTFAAAGAIGGERTLEILDFPAGSGTPSEGAMLEVAVPPGALGHSQDAFADGGRSKVTWTAGGADLTDGGASDGIMLDLISIDVGGVDVTVMVQDTAGGASSLVLSPLVVGPNNFFFADFIGDADFTITDVIMLEIEADNQSDLVLDFFETSQVPPPPGEGVPEPVSATLGLMGLGALAHATRRR